MLTRTDMQLLALRAMFDLPFYLMIFGAALLELRRPRCGWPVLRAARAGRAAAAGGVAAGRRLLALARARRRRARMLIRYALLVAAAPVLWLLADLIVTGEPLYSLTSTREVSGEFGRNRGLRRRDRARSRATRAATTGSSPSGSAGSACSLAVYILRRRAALPLALGGLGAADVPDHRRRPGCR